MHQYNNFYNNLQIGLTLTEWVFFLTSISMPKRCCPAAEMSGIINREGTDIRTDFKKLTTRLVNQPLKR
jgi:hypothetical protein